MAGIPQAFGTGSAVALTDAATITLNLASTPGNAFSVTLGGNRTLNVTNMVEGQILRGFITQDGTGTRIPTITLNGVAVLTSGTPLSTSAGSKDLVELQIRDGVAYYYPVAKAFA